MGHIVTKSNYNMNGPLTKGVEVTFIDVKNLAKGSGDPYLLMKCGFKAVRSSIKKTKKWNEVFNMKLIDNETDTDHGGTSKDCTVELFGWKKNQSHHLFGSCKLNLETMDENEAGEKKSYDLMDANGHKVGVLRLIVKYFDLEAHDIAKSHEVTVVAENYCHMYRLETFRVDALRTFYDHSKIPDLKYRLPTVIEEEEGEYNDFVEKEGTKLAWRRPSKPILEVKKVDNLLEHLEEVDEDSEEESSDEDESSEEEVRLTLSEIQDRKERMKNFRKETQDRGDVLSERGNASTLHQGRGHTHVVVASEAGSPDKAKSSTDKMEDLKLPTISSPKQSEEVSELSKLIEDKMIEEEEEEEVVDHADADDDAGDDGEKEKEKKKKVQGSPPSGERKVLEAGTFAVVEDKKTEGERKPRKSKEGRKSRKSKSPSPKSGKVRKLGISAERAKIMADMEDDSPSLDSSGHGGAIIKRAKQDSMDAKAFTERVKRRNSVSADPGLVAQLMGAAAGNKDVAAQGKQLRKSQWAGRSTIRAPTLSYSGKAGDDHLKKLLPSKDEITDMKGPMKGPKSPAKNPLGVITPKSAKTKGNPSFREGVRQSVRRGSVQVAKIAERRISLLDRAKQMHVVEKDWDNVSELDAMKYEKKTGASRTSFFIEWGMGGK